MVFANTVQALNDLSIISKKNYFTVTRNILDKILVSINECFEWGQVFL